MTDYIVPSEALEWLEEDSDTWFTEYEGARIEISNPEDYKNKSDLTFEGEEDAHVKLIEIVRCRECKYQKPDEIYGRKTGVDFFKCTITGYRFPYYALSNFCSWGERRKDA